MRSVDVRVRALEERADLGGGVLTEAEFLRLLGKPSKTEAERAAMGKAWMAWVKAWSVAERDVDAMDVDKGRVARFDILAILGYTIS